MKNKEQVINEMAEIIRVGIDEKRPIDKMNKNAKFSEKIRDMLVNEWKNEELPILVNAGYRKKSDVVKEVLTVLYESIETELQFCDDCFVVGYRNAQSKIQSFAAAYGVKLGAE